MTALARPMRQTQRRKLINQARDLGEAKATSPIAAMLDRQRKTLNRELRRANLRKRLKKFIDNGELLLKADDLGDWSAWADAFAVGVEDALTPVVVGVGEAETKYWLTRELRPDPVSPQGVFRAYQARTGRQIKDIPMGIRDGALKDITQWYNLDSSLSELIATLEQYFLPSRAKMIARTESTYITSQVALDMYRQFNIGYWLWDLADSVGKWPCEQCVAKAQGNPYKVGDPMPPDGSHPNCRCGTIPSTADGGELIYGADL